MPVIDSVTHHITPRSFLPHKDKSFVDDPRNIANITKFQHGHAHIWLYRLTGEWRQLAVGRAMLNESFHTLGETGDLCHNYGKTASEETKKKLRDCRTGRVYSPHSEETKNKISISMTGRVGHLKGKHHSKETKTKLSEAAKSLEKKTCPHCDKKCSPSNAARWHFDNCRDKQEVTLFQS